MRRPIRFLAPVVSLVTALGVAGAAVGAGAGVAHTTPEVPTVVAVRAASHPGYDRVVFEFQGGLPAYRNVRYVDQVLGGGSGLPVRVAGDAKLQVTFRTARANDGAGHPTVDLRTAYNLKSIHEVVASGDLDGVAAFGVGLAKRSRLHVFTLRSPARVVVDVDTRYRTVPVKIWLADLPATAEQGSPVVRPVTRQVATPRRAAGALHRLFAGATPAEAATGLRTASPWPTGWTNLSIKRRVARVQLTGQCDSRFDIGLAQEIIRTLKQFRTVHAVKIYDLAGRTPVPTGVVDSVPSCLRR